ncbi:MAG: hypothetical protein A2648_00835 [Candidatus Lloydbacteria bacterium RIFCSPHIGHO2_01_FULL_41_20]|uniref:UDP-N-acetylmuramate--L-alanine ligase n=1 Tax=Candidatus Lloydbacteria bacterium RIFCSPHIGHO2_01_FULL_41_20 TaxID=1798657 RepID=A0A1G2CTB4_9BACT|nr:MAG: hypothetical protein A2648_00835 [Candidatus Lloydbacteria bacterium RIFCSPHIGHO2_01_FULL_41_20]
MKEIDFGKVKKVHFIGIGGIGISALAQLMHHDGKIVFGTNDNPSPETLDGLRALGVPIYVGADVKNISSDTDLLVYSVAWDDMEFEFMKKVRSLGIPILTYFEALGLVSGHKKTIAVSGTHGKTTTTAMIAKVFLDAGKDPTVVVGSKLLEQKSNFVAGKGEYFIVEACEYKRSFLNINPTIAVITNIDNDHLDYYKDFDDIQSAFHEFVSKVPSMGVLICDVKNERLAPVIKDLKCKVINYMDFYDANLKLSVPGEHNRKNAAVALATSSITGIDIEKAKTSLEGFRGTWRRFEYKGETSTGALVYDDYGHHPTEIKVTISGAREKFPDKKLTVIFQPHLYSRTKILFNDFVPALSMADRVVITDIYAAREPNDTSINGEMLAEAVKIINKNTLYISDFNEISSYLNKNTAADDVLITMGAGDIYKIGEKLVGGVQDTY